MKRCFPLFVTWLVFAAGSVWANDINRFSQSIAPAERKEAGLDRLSSDQIAVIDALVRRDITALGENRAMKGAAFSDRLTADERSNAGFGTLVPEERARLDALVERHEVPRIARALLSASPVYVSRPVGPVRVTRDTEELKLHGSLSLSFGVGSGGYSERTGAMTVRVDDPKGRYSVAGGYIESHVKNARYYYYDSEQPYLRRTGLYGPEPIEAIEGDFTTRTQWISAEVDLTKLWKSD